MNVEVDGSRSKSRAELGSDFGEDLMVVDVEEHRILEDNVEEVA
jgi:hypothetical protein